jgi:hypothetical protein
MSLGTDRCPHCDGEVHVDKPWLDGVCLSCGAAVNAALL